MAQTCTISHGVKQGRVLSPILYSVYVDNLIRILRDSKIGCMYNNEYIGFFFTYADDISLLCPTLSGIHFFYRYVKSMPLITKLHLMLLIIIISCHQTISQPHFLFKNTWCYKENII